MQTFLEHVRGLDAAARDAVLSDVGAPWVDRIDACKSFFDWLPVEDNLSATRAVGRRLGPKRTHDFFVDLQSTTLRTPLFDWVQRHADVLLGPDPALRLKWVAKGYGIMFQRAGSWRVKDARPGSASLEMIDVPEALLATRIWLESVASSLHACFPGGTTVKLASASPAVGRALYRIAWGCGDGVGSED